MRMWNVRPNLMCKQHLLGEHRELHALVGIVNKDTSLQGYYDNGLVNPHEIVERHKVLKEEMEQRGHDHQSPLTWSDFDQDPPEKTTVDVEESYRELYSRCDACANRFDNNSLENTPVNKEDIT